MSTFLLILHLLVSLLLITVVLLQSGKSADLAGAFGGYGSQSSFGPRGMATFMSKFTTILAILFMVITLLLMIISKNDVKKSSTKSSVAGSEYNVLVQDATTQKPIKAVTVKYYQGSKTVINQNDKDAQDTKKAVSNMNRKETNVKGIAAINGIIADKPIFFTVSASGYKTVTDFEVTKFKKKENIIINLEKLEGRTEKKIEDKKTETPKEEVKKETPVKKVDTEKKK